MNRDNAGAAPPPKVRTEAEPFIPYVPEDRYPAELKAKLDPYVTRMGFVPNALKLYMHRPEIASTLWTLNDSVMRDPSSHLDRFLKRRLGAVASKINGCTYCTSHHCGILRNDSESDAEGWGLSDGDLRSLLTTDLEPKDERERVCFDFVRAASEDPRSVPDEIYERLTKHLTPPQIVELACVVGFWKLYNTVHDSLRVPLEARLLDVSGYVDL